MRKCHSEPAVAAADSRNGGHVVPCRRDGSREPCTHGSRRSSCFQGIGSDDKGSWPPCRATSSSSIAQQDRRAAASPHGSSSCFRWRARWIGNGIYMSCATPLLHRSVFSFYRPVDKTAILPPAVRARAARYRPYNPLPISWNLRTRRSAPARSHASSACGKGSLRALTALFHQLGRPGS